MLRTGVMPMPSVKNTVGRSALFTHYCGQRHKSGTFTGWRITAKKRMVAKLKAIKVELQRRMHDRMAEVGAWLRKVVLGYYQYHAVPGNMTQLRIFKLRVCRLWQSVLVRRSQRAQMRCMSATMRVFVTTSFRSAL